MTNSRLRVHFEEKSIDKIFSVLDTSHLPGAAVGIAIDGRPVYRKAFGLASMELPLTLTPQTRMRIYSMTKQFTCLAYLLFCEEGKAGIDDKVGKYLPSLHPITHRVTMRQLMSHTSGLRDANELRWFFSGIEGIVPAHELLSLYGDIQDVNFTPGEGWCYNGGAYHILSAVIEKIAQQPLQEVFQKRIFEPAEMHDTLLRRVDTDFVPNSASMHMTGPGGAYEKTYLPGELVGGGGAVSTVDDMLRWLRHMARPVVGQPETWALMSSSHVLPGGAETGYGLGLVRFRYHGIDTTCHGGGGLGNNSQMIRVPEAGLDLVVLVNRHDVSSADLAGKVLDACLGAGFRPSCSTPNRATGLFRSPTTGRVIQLYVKQEKQMAMVDGAVDWELDSREDQTLRPKPSAFWHFALKAHGNPDRPDSIRYECFGSTDELFPIPTSPESERKSISGEYRANTVGVSISVTADPEAGCMRTQGQFGSERYRLEGLGERLWRVRPTGTTLWSGILSVDPAGAALTISTSRNWRLTFRRST